MNFLFVGLGNIALRHINIIKKIKPESKIIYFNIRNRKINTKKVKIDFMSSQLSECLKYKLDAAFICNHADKHIYYAKILSKKGIHLFIEKPLSNKNDLNLRNFISYTQRKKIILHVGYNFRYSNLLIKLKSIIHNKSYGECKFFNIECGQSIQSWRKDVNVYGTNSLSKNSGGVIRELSHELEYITWIFGKIIDMKINKDKIGILKYSVEDFANYILKTKLNKKTIYGSVSIDFIRNVSKRKIRIVLDRTDLTCDLIKGKIIDNVKQKIVYYEKSPIQKSYINQMKCFLKKIEKKDNKKYYDELSIVSLNDKLLK